MPIYEYGCPKCGRKFEALKSMGERQFSPCPECNSESEIVPSIFGFKLYNPFTKDGVGFTSEIAHPDKLSELQEENRRK